MTRRERPTHYYWTQQWIYTAKGRGHCRAVTACPPLPAFKFEIAVQGPIIQISRLKFKFHLNWVLNRKGIVWYVKALRTTVITPSWLSRDHNDRPRVRVKVIGDQRWPNLNAQLCPWPQMSSFEETDSRGPARPERQLNWVTRNLKPTILWCY